MRLRLTRLQYEAERVVSLEFRDVANEALPPWEPGGHVELTLPSGKTRQYSLCGETSDRYHYVVAVLRVPDGRGGSTEVHDRLRVGELVDVSAPRNNFALDDAPAYLLLAGGIGITPIVPMVEELHRQGADWRLLYGARSRAAMAFAERVAGLPGERTALVCEEESGLVDLAAAFDRLSPGTHVYCCGPTGMLQAARQLAADRPVTLRTEQFTATPGRAMHATSSFQVELARSNLVLEVPTGRSVLEVVREVLPDTPSSCESGYCGTCETKVLAGRPDHRDDLLTEEEQEESASMMICVSRASPGDRLVLDL